jgi:vacuolar-type H+-ATPase subunit H
MPAINMGVPPGPPPSGADSSIPTDTARDQARQVKDSAAGATSQVTQTATEQAQQVTQDVRRQAKQLADETKNQLSGQASSQRDQAVSSLRSLGDELSDMSDGSPQSGLGTQLAREGSDLTRKVADFLEQREPAQLLEEVRQLARRRPGAFLIGAALAGVAVGRLTRGAVSANSSTSSDQPADATGAPAPVYGGTHLGAQAAPLSPGTTVPGWAGAQSGPPVTGPANPPPILNEPYGEQAPPPGYSGRPGGFS